ncbi:hypothetical protein M430DRAFT_34902 [Amorphotheca resinae ATCC 22711]|uniref:Uncharacterized protein n=1 Tax=Amorphotheca resinae ATCC 22711 TaxID=857342 RepID=A0A2T3B501_AMORE|nr:hypothetical protein M430DRAFT_34902 [Amorphotheca resinae ATCC 22711]PSS20716.1 hypothetical protein M430DRAFT_34902 [Amorphotheca resinae ATCC 22711]
MQPYHGSEVPPGVECAGSPSSQSSTNSTQVEMPSSRAIIADGCGTEDIAEVSRALLAASSSGLQKYQQLLYLSLTRAVYRGQADVVRYLIEQKGAPLDSLFPLKVASSPSIELFQVLVDNGWDINRSGAGRGKRLLQLVCHDESLVRWCLDHGASVDGLHVDPYISPPLLETVASNGTVPIFTLLHSRGAQLGPRTLHCAVASASSSSLECLPTRMAMVEYLVDNLGLDVNALDTDGQLPNHWGTPLCYAAKYQRGSKEVVRFLLSRGADPSIKDCWGIHDAFSFAEFTKNFTVLEALREWRVQN